jgi:hypothetical protein
VFTVLAHMVRMTRTTVINVLTTPSGIPSFGHYKPVAYIYICVWTAGQA